jgi:hypothetical protein
LAELYNLIPNLADVRFESDKEEYNEPQYATEMHPAEYGRECKF